MAWPYKFIILDKQGVAIRRATLDRYASYAHYSALLPAVLFLLFRLSRRLAKQASGKRGGYDSIRDSPSLKSRRLSPAGIWHARARQVRWWLADDAVFMGQNWGQRDQWVFGVAWFCWLLTLCVVGTGEDYLHLTKRFGIIAASQLPFQYLLALKALNPFAWVFQSSHEQVNKWHRTLGRVIYSLLVLHASFYLNFFVQSGIIQTRLFAPIVFAGFTAFILLNLLNGTALAAVRTYSYRIFFITHLMVAFVIPFLISFHAAPARVFVFEALGCFVVDLVTRKLVYTTPAQAAIETIPGTNLVKIVASTLPQNVMNNFRQHPGAHIYLTIPEPASPNSNSTSTAVLFKFLLNPFTVASTDVESGDLLLVVRQLGGPMTQRLANFATDSSSTEGKIPLCVEGPYGAVAHNFSTIAGLDIDRTLIVAGGVGATFAVPMYRAIVADNPTAKVKLVWSVRGAGEAMWAVAGSGQSILDDENVHVYLTGGILNSGGGVSDSSDNGEVEMSTMHRGRRSKHIGNQNRERPNLQKIVDDVFRHGSEERVAVLVCGPEEMARDLRNCVTPWVMKGRDVLWHNESFGW